MGSWLTFAALADGDEIIVVDDCSSDSTPEMVRKNWARPEITVVRLKRLNLYM